MKNTLLSLIALIAILAPYILCAEPIAQSLHVVVPDKWQLEYKGDGIQFYSLTRKDGDSALLMFSRWVTSGNVNQIPQYIESLASGFIEEASKQKEFKLDSEEYEIQDIAGEHYSGKFVQFSVQGGVLQIMFMVGDNNGIWNGQFTGTKERWDEALAVLKSLKQKQG